MRRKKLAIFLSLITIFTLVLVMIPLQSLYAHPSISLSDGGTHGVDCGTNRHSIKYNVQDGEVAEYYLDKDLYQPPGWNSSSNFYKVVLKNVAGEIFSVDFSGFGVIHIDGYDVFYASADAVIVDELPAGGGDTVCIKFYYTGDPNADCPPEEEVWVRTMPMTCWQVWINEDNDFQFIFWYPYKDNNWVKIYDMEDNMVYEVDLPVNDPNLIVDLPDGMYMVRTYHGEVMLQEFLIGKP